MNEGAAPPAPASAHAPRSLRLRMLAAVLAWVALCIAGIWFSATGVFTRYVEQQFHDELAVHIQELDGLATLDREGRVALARPLSDPRYLVPLSGFYWQISVDGGATLRSPSMTRGALDPGVAASGEVAHRVVPGPTGPAIAYGLARRGASGQVARLVIATDQRLLDETLGGFTRELALWLSGLALALLATGFAVVAFGFHPLKRIGREIAQLRGGRASRLEGRYPAEVAPLVDDLNAYIAKNAAIVGKGRAEAGALAHALRTPLAVITDEAERLAREGGMADSAALLLDQARIMGQQIDYRLARARSASARGVAGSISRVDETLGPILSAMARLHPVIRFEYEELGDAAPVMPVDPVDLSEMLSILVDNAGKWARSTVTITVHGGEAPLVEVMDDGPGMTAAQIAGAFELGSRFDESKPGSGLGLAIAQDLAASYGLRIDLAARGDGASGLVVRLAPAG